MNTPLDGLQANELWNTRANTPESSAAQGAMGDERALNLSRQIMAIVNGTWHPGGAAQIQAKIQEAIIAANMPESEMRFKKPKGQPVRLKPLVVKQLADLIMSLSLRVAEQANNPNDTELCKQADDMLIDLAQPSDATAQPSANIDEALGKAIDQTCNVIREAGKNEYSKDELDDICNQVYLMFGRAVSAGVAQPSDATAQQIYQIRHIYDTPVCPVYAWSDVSEDAYNLTPEDDRRILYVSLANTAQGKTEQCPTCRGNDDDAPCAYPSCGMTGCLRDKRLAAKKG